MRQNDIFSRHRCLIRASERDKKLYLSNSLSQILAMCRTVNDAGRCFDHSLLNVINNMFEICLFSFVDLAAVDDNFLQNVDKLMHLIYEDDDYVK